MTDCSRCANFIVRDQEHIVIVSPNGVQDTIFHYCSAKCMVEDFQEKASK